MSMEKQSAARMTGPRVEPPASRNRDPAPEPASRWPLVVQRKSDGAVESPATTAVADPAVIVDGEATLLPGQMTRTEFLARLREEVLTTCDAALGPDWSAIGCPYVDAWFERHTDTDAATLQSLARRYTGLSSVDDATLYIAAACDRLRQSVARWRDGEDVSADLLAAGAAETAAPIEAVQTKAEGGATRPAQDAVGLVARLGPGAPPDPHAARLGAALGQSLGNVRIHTDPGAGRLAEELDAAAFTVGHHVAFAPGRYRPGFPEGDALLAHEMAHVQQQRRGAKGRESWAGPASLEADADRLALASVARLYSDDVEALPRAAASLKGGLALKRCSKSDADKKKERLASLERRKAELDVIKGSPTTSSFGVLAAAMTESLDVEHKVGVEKTGQGILTGTKSGEAPASGVKKSDCTILVLDVLEQAFTAQGKAADWKKAKAKALELAKTRGGGISGIDIQQALVSELGWKGIFWAPDPSFHYTSEADKSEHAVAYKKARESGTYYGLPVEQSVVNYAPREGSGTTKETSQLQNLQAIPFGVLSARGARHMALIVRGTVYEVHWNETSDKPNVIEGTVLEKWAWLSGAIVVPTEDFRAAFSSRP
jgi:hypothetical protein